MPVLGSVAPGAAVVGVLVLSPPGGTVVDATVVLEVPEVVAGTVADTATVGVAVTVAGAAVVETLALAVRPVASLYGSGPSVSFGSSRTSPGPSVVTCFDPESDRVATTMPATTSASAASPAK
jgi:hypothetical protein